MFPLISLSGLPHERGRQYGRQASALIRHSIASYARLFAYRCGQDWATILERAEAYAPVLAASAPDLLEEMQGIAEGAERAFLEIVALNARTELLAGATGNGAHRAFAPAQQRNQASAVPDHGECTTVAALPAATANNATLLAQTWDWNGDQRAACVLLRITLPDGLTILTLTEAGMLAKIGLNSAGVGVCLNILRSQADGEVPGMPIHVVLRRMLHTTSFASALDVVANDPMAASSCLTVADTTGQVASLEVTPHGTERIDPEEGVLAHTNHCLADATRDGECLLDPASSTVPRYNRAQELLQAAHGQIDTATLMALLRDRHGAPSSICRTPDMRLHPAERPESVAGIVMDLPQRTMHIAPGVPCEVAFEPVDLVR